ncbi:O-acetyl-ADP-ribose deacetylase [Microbacterium caowuchunii]|nr:O-acetyl-ADP-ribose deacetylase [Microbacterium caowuchunii]QEV99402.1 O-acetyl-ADP-ribose deacetylase [Microbacterium caowuchunii]
MVTVTAVHGDITEQAVDAIVNAANRHMRGGGGVDGAIHRAGGRAILDECIARFPDGLRTGDAGWTTAGKLPARWVIHAVGPNHQAGEQDRSLLESCYRRALAIADELGARSMAFPLISAGVYGWPLDDALDVALETIAHTLTRVEDVRLVSFNESTHRRVRAQVLRHFPPPTDPRSVGQLLDRAPYQWGFRGDAYLWRAMRAEFASVPLPADAWALEELIRTAFESITGRALTDEDEPFHVPEFDPGHGMSAGGITPSWWASTAIPILIDRFEATLPVEPGDDGLSVAAAGPDRSAI